MEFLRDEDINKVGDVTETSDDKTIIFSETESRLGDPDVELETPEAWLDKQDRDNKEPSGKRLRWLHVIGENRKFSNQIYLFNSAFREEDPALCCVACRCNICSCCSHFLF